MNKKDSGLYDKRGVPIQGGSTIKVKLADNKYHFFDVLWCTGAFKIMETKSMFDGAKDGWLHELAGTCLCFEKKPKLSNVLVVKHD